MRNKLFPISFLIAILILAFLGFLDAGYLTVLHYKHITPPCSLTHGCETVLSSQYATVGPIPFALIGVLFYVAIITLTMLFWQTKNKLISKVLFFLVFAGFVISLGLVGLQAFVIHAFCQYCLTSEAITTGIFLLSFLVRSHSNTS